MRLCLDIYMYRRNPHVLDPLCQFLILPSNKTIRLYKNKVKETVGWNPEVLRWCLNAAKESGMKEADYMGGLVIDEMKIQENLEMINVGGKHKLVGFVDRGKGHELMTALSGYTRWCILDGAECNRQFIKLHYKDKNPVETKFVARNFYTGGPMIFIMDPKHNIKKIRNNIEKSNQRGQPRCLKVNGQQITWDQFKSAFNWDQESFSLPLHENLTIQHFELDPASKMRNKLAEDVLDSKMLFLMQKYQEHITASTGEEESALDSVISLLEHTSELVNLFNDRMYINSTNDTRLQIKLNNFYSWMSHWEEKTGGNNKEFISSKLWFDLHSMCLGFQSLVHYKLCKFPSSVIKPCIVNQDCVENHFCQIRSCNGQNDNPTFLQQQSSQNSIRLGQTTISPKSNASCNSTCIDQRPSIPSKNKYFISGD